MKGKTRLKVITIFLILIVAAVYYYVTLPAINIHSAGIWGFMIVGVAVLLLIYILRRMMRPIDGPIPGRMSFDLHAMRQSRLVRAGLAVLLALLVIYLVGSILSSPIVNASRYQKLLTVEESEFTEDIEQISYDQIPILDKDSAAILGERKMGSLVDLASQFEVSDYYSQINYQGEPVRVSPLRYADLIKWFTNMRQGLPGYIRIDMATQDTELVRLSEGLKYTPFDHFQRNLYRHLRFHYPTYIFDDVDFEIDEDENPVWVCSVAKFNIGLFGGKTVGRVVIVDAITGACSDYAVDEAPTWIDKVYSADLLVQLYDYYGTLKHGFINSILGQRDCLTTTNGYNYLALNDDVWVYTGVTSITSDQSNVGFVLMNQRTMETKYYEVEGAIEDSAMSSAEGKVQNLKYTATFPLLLNIAGQPTYFIALKDDSGLVKMYAMVSVQKSQIVGTGDSVSDCEATYVSLLQENGIENDEEEVIELSKASGTIAKIAEGVVDGNSHYYLLLENDENIYDITVSENLPILFYEVGDEITLRYQGGNDVCIVFSLEE